MDIGRSKLPHETPLGVIPEEALFFITICAKIRGSSELVIDFRAETILEAVRYRNASGIWHASIFLVMPDHVHGLIRFHNPDHPMKKAMTDFKRWTTKGTGVLWQWDFFDHRIRHDESEREKGDYILMNPVRAGLVDQAEDWPYVFVA